MQRSISIQNIAFLSVGAVISDMEQFNQASCTKVYGIIGANMMNKAVWQIDYALKKLILTNNKDSLNLPTEKNRISFSTDGQGTPKFHLTTSTGMNELVILDTGADGIYLPLKNMQFLPNSTPIVKGHGLKFSAFGGFLDTTSFTRLLNLRIGNDFDLKNTVVGFKKKIHIGAIGNSFLKNYIVTIDWKYQDILLTANSNPSFKDIFHNSFGFKPRYNNGKVLISYVYENSGVSNEVLKFNDQIIEINGKNVGNTTQEEFCSLLFSEMDETKKEISIKIRRANNEINYQLKRTDWFKL